MVSVIHKRSLSQQKHTQETFWAKAPPIIGPVTDPIDHIALIMPNHCPRILNGTRSVTTISVSTSKPPPPIPCKERPTSNVAKLFATPATIAPIIKRTRAIIITGFRPKMWEKEAKFGWKMVEQRRKEVPDQKASIAVPLSLSAMIYISAGSDPEYAVWGNLRRRNLLESPQIVMYRPRPPSRWWHTVWERLGRYELKAWTLVFWSLHGSMTASLSHHRVLCPWMLVVE